MMKKVTALVLCILLTVSLVPQVQAATEDDLRKAVEDRYDAYAKSIYQKDAADNAIDVMLKQGLYGKGKTLHFSEKDPLVAALYETNLFRVCLTETLCIAFQVMLEQQMDEALFGTSSLAWHDYAKEYRVAQFHYNDTPDVEDDVVMSRLTAHTIYNGPSNYNDKAMMLIVGGCDLRVRIHLLEQSFDTASYQVDVYVGDEFEFGDNYDEAEEMGFDTSFSKLISALGPLMGMDEYFWDCSTGFEITVPLVYRCKHQSGDYRWEHDGTDFAAVQAEGLTAVAANRVDYTNNDGTAFHYYQLDNPITLLHDVTWVLEFRQKGSQGFMIGPDTQWTSGNPYFLRTAEHMLVGHYDPAEDRKGRHQYGFHTTPLGYSWRDWHTFRIENRIAEDGSNMLWLLIDGQELGPMTHYYYNPTYVNTDMGTTDQWASGVDFTIAYIGGTSFPIKGQFEYVAIWQDGPGNPHDPFLPGSTAPTCTEPGYSTRTCSFCGYTEAMSSTPALGHKETVLPGLFATCTEAGLTEGVQCDTCKEILKPQETLPALGHKETILPGISATCTEAGLTEGVQCDTCKEILKPQETLPALGHKQTALSAAAPTCTGTGLTEGIQCDTCKEILKAQETLPALGHSYEKGHCTLCDLLDPDFLTGDANFDGILNYQDALIILRASINLADCETALCDMDGNGILNYQDALTVLRASIGL